jgi:hypothetical protein
VCAVVVALVTDAAGANSSLMRHHGVVPCGQSLRQRRSFGGTSCRSDQKVWIQELQPLVRSRSNIVNGPSTVQTSWSSDCDERDRPARFCQHVVEWWCLTRLRGPAHCRGRRNQIKARRAGGSRGQSGAAASEPSGPGAIASEENAISSRWQRRQRRRAHGGHRAGG